MIAVKKIIKKFAFTEVTGLACMLNTTHAAFMHAVFYPRASCGSWVYHNGMNYLHESASERVQAPQLKAPKLLEATPSDQRVLDENYVDNAIFVSPNWAGLDQNGATFNTCRLTSAVLDRALWEGTRWVNCLLERASIAQADLEGSSWDRTQIVGSRLGVFDLTNASVSSLEFVDCKIDLLNLRGAKVKDLRFTRCAVQELDTTNAVVSRIDFPDSSLNTLIAHQTRFAHADLRGLEPARINGIGSLRGTIVDSYQLSQLAPSFAQELGITIA